MTCPYLEYHATADGQSFDVARAYCGVVEGFVQPMRADVCNDRYDLHHADHCEVYRNHEAEATDGRGRAASGTEGGDSGRTDGGEADS